MTRQQGLFISSLHDSFGFTQDQARELFRAYGLKTPPQEWDDADVKRAEEILNLCGPSFERVAAIKRQADAEWAKQQQERAQREQRKARTAA